jgi:hypothetical protein
MNEFDIGWVFWVSFTNQLAAIAVRYDLDMKDDNQCEDCLELLKSTAIRN